MALTRILKYAQRSFDRDGWTDTLCFHARLYDIEQDIAINDDTHTESTQKIEIYADYLD